MLYVGLDLSRRRLDFDVLLPDGGRLERGAVPPDVDGLASLVQRLDVMKRASTDCDTFAAQLPRRREAQARCCTRRSIFTRASFKRRRSIQAAARSATHSFRVVAAVLDTVGSLVSMLLLCVAGLKPDHRARSLVSDDRRLCQRPF
jgi:hypothetical protein